MRWLRRLIAAACTASKWPARAAPALAAEILNGSTDHAYTADVSSLFRHGQTQETIFRSNPSNGSRKRRD
jgi:hypothetical protein